MQIQFFSRTGNCHYKHKKGTMLNELKKKREPVADIEQETAWRCPQCPRIVQSRTDPSMKLFKPTETRSLLETRTHLMLKCFTEKASLPGMGLLVKKKKKKGEIIFTPQPQFWDSLITHISLVKKDYKSVPALSNVPANDNSTSDCYEASC